MGECKRGASHSSWWQTDPCGDDQTPCRCHRTSREEETISWEGSHLDSLSVLLEFSSSLEYTLPGNYVDNVQLRQGNDLLDQSTSLRLP